MRAEVVRNGCCKEQQSTIDRAASCRHAKTQGIDPRSRDHGSSRMQLRSGRVCLSANDAQKSERTTSDRSALE